MTGAVAAAGKSRSFSLLGLDREQALCGDWTSSQVIPNARCAYRLDCCGRISARPQNITTDKEPNR